MQEELAEAAGLSVRAVAYLERGAVTTPQRETVRLLAGALGLAGAARAGFEAAARGRAGPGGVAVATRTPGQSPRCSRLSTFPQPRSSTAT
jgi:transcriptional regulator with XRE-family HTH domain